MSLNSFASSNESLPLSYIHFTLPFGLVCLIAEPTSFIFTSYTFFNILFLLPLCIFILYYGLRQRWKQCSCFTAAVTSHSDTFTYHLIIMETISVFGCILYCCGIYMNQLPLLYLGTHIFTFTWYGESFFHVLTCLEHYLAVVHPLIYLSLRKERGIRIRNISISCIWLLCIGGAILIELDIVSVIVMFCLLITSLIIISFCCLSVLRVLIRPGPGKKGRDQGEIDQSKQRAFYTIMAILAVLLLRCAFCLVWAVLYVLKTGINICVVVLGEIWINVPGSLVLPLLFLQRAGMLACCNNVK